MHPAVLVLAFVQLPLLLWMEALLTLMGGPEFLPAVPVLRMLLLSVPGMTFATVMAPQWVGRGFFARVGALSLGVSAVGVAAAWIGIRAYGAAGFVLPYAVGVVVNGAMAVWVQRTSRADRVPVATPVLPASAADATP
ncbi:hypothetical protein [Longimicrobium sp.]|uniref:hypothetical protein n=1 Tax=Longimicrobium sp. TaxID=2029185 RepID=UPI002E36C15B|nr:hypothetical protein [Longimicrobium sp.]HEX6038761.1 hypothetical protein [Longimicrobium sp.]